MKRIATVAGMLLVVFTAGCMTEQGDTVTFLGISDNQSSDKGPVGLINGQPCQIKNVSAVRETAFQEYLAAKQSGRVFAEEMHGDTVYYAVKENKDVRFDNASAWVEVIERYKARKP